MQALFAISILSLSALLWASISVTRYILVTQRRPSQTQQPPEAFAEVLIEDKLAQFRGHTRPISQIHPAYTHLEPALLRPQPTPKPVAADPRRMDWDYFKKNLGDLTAPYEANARARHN